MKYSLAVIALAGFTSAINLKASDPSGCAEPLEMSQVELDIQLDYFSRRLDR